MRYQILAVLVVAVAVLTSCIPKNQYEAMVTERNYYRNENLAADSIAEQAGLSSYDNADLAIGDLDNRIRQVEALTATNRALNDSYQSLQSRYEELLDQNQSMLSNSGNQVTDLQQSLAERTNEVSRREAELRQVELDLLAREQTVANVEATYAAAGGDGSAAPASYGRVGGNIPLSANQNAAMELNVIQAALGPVLSRLPVGSYVLSPYGSNRLQLSLGENVLFTDGFTVSRTGQDLLRDVANTLRSHPSSEIVVVGHSDGGNPNALRAYEDSTDRAINVATQLVNFGANPGKVIAGGKGYHDPVTDNGTPAGQQANRRTDIMIVIPQ